MTKKKSLAVVSILLLLLTCGLCLFAVGCSTNDIDGASLECSKTDTLQLKVGDTLSTALNGVTVTFTFGYDIEIGGVEYTEGSTLVANGYAEMNTKGFEISDFDTTSKTKDKETRELTISYLNKSVTIKYTVS